LTLENRLVLWLKDLPCSQLQQLELSQYAIVAHEPPVKPQTASNTPGTGGGSGSGGEGADATADSPDGSQPQQQQGDEDTGGEGAVAGADRARIARLSLQDEDQQPEAPTDANSSSNSSNAGTFCQDCDLSGLQHFALVDCSCLLVILPPDSDSNADAGAQPKPAGLTSMQPLLARLTGPAATAAGGTTGKLSGGCNSSLRTLWLDDVMLCLSTIQYICSSPLGKKLQELHVYTRTWWDESNRARARGNTGPASGSKQPHPDSDSIAAALAAAVPAGNFSKLRHLSLKLSVLGGGPGGADLTVLGTSALTACAGFTSLQELYLRLGEGSHSGNTSEGMSSGWCGCRVGLAKPWAVPTFAGPWWDVLQMQHLRVLEVALAAGESRLAPSLRELRHAQDMLTRREYVVGACSRCCGAVGERSLRRLMGCATAGRLSGCHMKVQVFPTSPEDQMAMLGAPPQVQAVPAAGEQAVPAGGAN
jgi:hypothetical protein